MKSSSSRRSSSVSRGGPSRSRGPRSSCTPSRRLSELQERPAWDATSQNLDKHKLTEDEQIRRKATRVSKNRPLALDTKRSFVEAWAKDVTASVMRADPETEHDQDRPDSSTPPPPAGALLGINYGSVVDMLRRSPAASSAAAAAAARVVDVRPTSAGVARLRVQRSGPGSGGASSGGGGSGGGFGGLTFSSVSGGAGGLATSAVAAAGASASPSVNPSRLPSFAHGMASAAAAAWERSEGGNGSMGPPLTAAVDTAGDTAAGSAAGLHRGEISVTPAALRPRFHAAESTTIIAYGDGSSSDDQDGHEVEEVAGEEEVAGDGQGRSSGPRRGMASGTEDHMAAAFEAALFGRGLHGGGAAGGGDGAAGVPRAWGSVRSSAAPLDNAAGEVERRLQALEMAVAVVGRGSGGIAAAAEELTELRAELRKVQHDNAKLRQELGAFSSHASALLTQLQAQVQQLLRGSAGGAPAASTAGPPPPHTRQQQQQPACSSMASAAAAEASWSLGPIPPPQQQQPQMQPQAPLHMPLLQQPQPVARRNIFADIETSTLRPAAAAPAAAPIRAAGGNGGGGAGSVDVGFGSSGGDIATGAYGASSYTVAAVSSRVTGMAAVTAASPRLAAWAAAEAASAPYAPHPVPVSNVEDADVALPSFAAFRRSSGAAAFTASRAIGASMQGPLLSPSDPYAAFVRASGLGPSASPYSMDDGGGDAADPSPAAAANGAGAGVPQRSFPTAYQPRTLGGVLARAGPSTAPGGVLPSGLAMGAAGPTSSASAAAAAAAANSGTYAAALAASAAAAAATRSDAAAVGLARAHSGLPQPLVFSVGPEFRSARASGLTAENSMSLSAHTAAAAAARSKASFAPR